MAELPQQLIEEILLRLPVKSLLRFESVSKKWHSLISQDHDFAKSHCKLSSALNNQIFFQDEEDKALFHILDIDTCASRIICFPGNKLATPCCVVGSANGLVCVAPLSKRYCYIWNPCSNKHRRISIPSCGDHLYGFGYDLYSDDYKIVGSDSQINIQIFSLKKNLWYVPKNSEICLYEVRSSFRAKGVLSNGALHWFAGPMQTKIISFNLSTDKFFIIKTPLQTDFGVCCYYWSWVPLFNYKGSLCICDEKWIWVMKEYGVEESWTTLATICASNFEKPVGISKFGKVRFHITNNPYSIFDRARVFQYIESQISPDCFDGPGPL